MAAHFHLPTAHVHRPTYAKAVMAAVTALLSQLALVLSDDRTFADVSQGQWVQVLLAAVVAGGAVYGVRNGREADRDTSTPQPRSDLAAR